MDGTGRPQDIAAPQEGGGGIHPPLCRDLPDDAREDRGLAAVTDLIAGLDPKHTDKKDRALLASLGWWETPDGFRPSDAPVAN